MPKKGNFLSFLQLLTRQDGPRLVDACRYLADVPSEKRFHMSTGERVSNLVELFETLRTVDDEQFHHHVNAERHDFHAWITHCIRDFSLAEDIRHVYDKDHMALIVGRRVHELLEVCQR